MFYQYFNIIRTLLLLLESGILFENFRTLQVRTPDDAKQNEFFALDFIGIVGQYGYNAEWHNVTTDDGYILSVFRLPPKPLLSNKTNENRVIFLQHGLLGTADAFVVRDSTRSLAYLLSDVGYDVWLGNLRGNTYSRRHKTLSPDAPEFWDFSIDEYAHSDLPAMIDYVISTTKQSRIMYVGYSLGTSIIMMLLSEQQQYNDKLNCIVLLAPVAYWNQDTPSTSFFLPAYLFKYSSPAGTTEFLPQNNLAPFIYKYICPMNKFTAEICALPIDLICGKDREQADPDTILKFFTYSIGGTSMKVFYHYLQHYDSGEFSHYDYRNNEVNFKHYGRINPPLYNLTKIRTSIIAVNSHNDPFSKEEQIEKLLKQFSNNTRVIHHVISYKKFNHVDFLIAKDAKQMIYNQLFQNMSQFHNDD